MAARWLAELNLELEAERSQIHGLIACQPQALFVAFLPMTRAVAASLGVADPLCSDPAAGPS
jgi:hypothetical protein